VAQELRRRQPSIDVNPDGLYVDNGAVLTSAGAAAGMDLCLHLVRRDLGAEVAAHTARAAVMPLERSGGQAQYIVYEQPAAVESMGPLLLWIEQNLDDRLPLSVIARHAAMSTRTLSRRFLEQVGATPAQWIACARQPGGEVVGGNQPVGRGRRGEIGIPIRLRAERAFRRDPGDSAPRLSAPFGGPTGP